MASLSSLRVRCGDGDCIIGRCWWLLFVVRQIITFSLSHLAQAILVEYLALRSKVSVVLLGPFVTLFLVQSKGWPMLTFLWALGDFLLLYGDWPLAAHW